MIEIIKRYTNEIGVEVVDYRNPETGWHGSTVTNGKSDEEIIAAIKASDALFEEFNSGPVLEGTPPVGSLQHRMQSEFEASNPGVTPLSEIWAEEQGHPPLSD